MTPKKYIHPILKRVANRFETDFVANGYKISDNKGLLVFGDNRTNNNALLALGFIEAPTDTEENGDDSEKYNRISDAQHAYITKGLTYKESIMQFMPKPVEQELIPLDVKKLTEEINDYCISHRHTFFTDRGAPHQVKQGLQKLISKYGVHKQEEDEGMTIEEANELISKESNSFGIDTQYPIIGRFTTATERKLFIPVAPTPTPQATSVDNSGLQDIRNIPKVNPNDDIRNVNKATNDEYTEILGNLDQDDYEEYCNNKESIITFLYNKYTGLKEDKKNVIEEKKKVEETKKYLLSISSKDTSVDVEKIIKIACDVYNYAITQNGVNYEATLRNQLTSLSISGKKYSIEYIMKITGAKNTLDINNPQFLAVLGFCELNGLLEE